MFASFWVAGADAEDMRPVGPRSGGTETIDQAFCRMIETSAATHRLAVEFFTRLIWRESSFRSGARSAAGAQGIAQFMPRTAAERGLADPFDPEQAIPEAAALLADLMRSFGNLGLAAAAYNGGPARVTNWLEGRGGLPTETRDYVVAVTGRSVDEWAAEAKARTGNEASDSSVAGGLGCLRLVALLRRPGASELASIGPAPESPFAPWGVQLAGNFSKAKALVSYARVRQAFSGIIGAATPMIIGTRLRSRGTHIFYRVRVPAATRDTANHLCNRLHAAGGACIVLRS